MGLRIITLALVGVASLAIAAPASAQMRHGSIAYAHQGRARGGQALVSDGPGTGFGFHRLPQPYRFAAAVHRDQQAHAVRETVVDDALTNGNGPYGFGLPGDSVYGYGNQASYGVFSGADGYGTPYFAGWYGPGDGADLGPLGHAYR